MTSRPAIYTFEQGLIKSEWQRYSEFLKIFEPHIDSVINDLEVTTDREAPDFEDDLELEDFYKWKREELYSLQHSKTILINAFVAISFALFEHHLVRLCAYAKRHHKTPFAVTDFGSARLEGTKNYLTKLDYQFPSNGLVWNRLKQYQEIRNKIMH